MAAAVAAATWRGVAAAAVNPPSLPNLRLQNSATVFDLGVYAARSYSLMMPSRTGLRLIRSWEGRRPGAPDTRLIDRSSAQD